MARTEQNVAKSAEITESTGLRAVVAPGGASASRGLLRTCRRHLAASAVALVAAMPAMVPCARAVNPDSPEVRELVEKGLAFLEKETDHRLGGKALVGLTFYKAGRGKDHPRVKEAIEACRGEVGAIAEENEIYSKAIAAIFLIEIGGHDALAAQYCGMLQAHQKEHGGYSYVSYQTGDTSQTQYAALTFWEMVNNGASPKAESVQKCLTWLMRTQDPSGLWAYQGHLPEDGDPNKLIPQEERPGQSMTAAGLGAALIMGNAMGLLKPPAEEIASGGGEDLPAALRRADEGPKKRVVTIPAGDVDRKRLLAAVERGKAWFDKNYKIENAEYQSYYLYSLERYRSFEEYIDGLIDEEPSWYQDGFQLLKKTQQGDGAWDDFAGKPCATAFSILFLLRSTQQTIKASLGEGTLVGGRGLPRDLSKVRLKGGKLVVETKPTEVDQLLGMLDDTESDALDALLDDPAALRVDAVSPKDARRLQQVVRSGNPQARVLAVRALAKMRSLDYVPTLLFAMTDPDRRVVREARDGLRLVSRKFEGFGLGDNFTDEERDLALDKWKQWYRTVRPDAPPLP